MEPLLNPGSALVWSAWLLLQLLNAPQALYLPLEIETEDESGDQLGTIVEAMGNPIHDPHSVMRSALHNFRLCTTYDMFGDDLGYWVKPRSTTWFSRFLLDQYDSTRWVQMFRMRKPAVFALANFLRPHVQKQDTKYRLAIPVLIRVACTLFKLSHGANLFICSEMFSIGKSTVSKVVREVVHAINDTMRHELMWPTGDRLQETQAKFYELCGLPGVVGAIDGTHVSIAKPQHVPADYYYFKSSGYTVNCQAVVDSEKRFLDLYLGMSGSTNDSRMLRRSSLYHLAMHGNLFAANDAVHGFTPYLIGNLGYPLLSWLMVPHRTQVQVSVAEGLFNKKLKKGRCVVENAFGLLKQSFRELLLKSDLNVAFLPDVITACAILHNVLLGQSHEDVERLLQILQTEGLDGEVVDEVAGPADGGDGVRDNVDTSQGSEKRLQLGVYLTLQRQHALENQDFSKV